MCVLASRRPRQALARRADDWVGEGTSLSQSSCKRILRRLNLAYLVRVGHQIWLIRGNLII